MTLRCWIRKEDYVQWESDNPLYHEGELETIMQFRLIYEGPLIANAPALQKHRIRKIIHKQLKELWQEQAPLKGIYNHKIPHTNITTGTRGFLRRLDQIADQHISGAYRFVPLICEQFGLACKLDILFLRRENPGQLISHGGDIDNRMKTLLDALQIPKNLDANIEPELGEKPMFVLLQNDILITELRITTDRLLIPVEKGKESSHIKNNVHLIMRVETQVVDPDVSHMMFV